MESAVHPSGPWIATVPVARAGAVLPPPPARLAMTTIRFAVEIQTPADSPSAALLALGALAVICLIAIATF